jgi:peroxiredoxin
MSSRLIAPGRRAPDFALQAHTGDGHVRLSDMHGTIVVLAFYVLDFTNT